MHADMVSGEPGLRAEMYNSPHTFAEQRSLPFNKLRAESPEGRKKRKKGKKKGLHLATRSFAATLPRNSSFPLYHIGLFHVRFCLFMRHVVTLLTANSLMDGMQSFSEQLKLKMSQANRMSGVLLVHRNTLRLRLDSGETLTQTVSVRLTRPLL